MGSLKFDIDIDADGNTIYRLPSMTRRTFAGIVAAVGATCVMAGPSGVLKAYAEDGTEVAQFDGGELVTESEIAEQSTHSGDLLLASFMTTGDTSTMYDVLYTSANGRFFEKIGAPYGPYKKSTGQYPFADPSIIYKDGTFYMLSNWNKQDGKIWPMIGYSLDLKTWTAPENSGLIGTPGIAVDSTPPGKNGKAFDTVAPDWFVDDDGTVYLVACCGYYASNHSDSGANDVMAPYISKVTTLSNGGIGSGSSKHPFPNQLAFRAGTAKRIHLDSGENNYIDASLYKEGSTYYLSIKSNGITNEIWSASDPMADNWKKVCGDVATGFEGPSLVKLNGRYFTYTDKLADYPPETKDASTGIFAITSKKLSSGWDMNERIATKKPSGGSVANRHGSAILISDATAKAIVLKARADAGWPEFGAYAYYADIEEDLVKNDLSVWYVNEGWIQDVETSGLMSGYTDGSTNFGPYDTILRGQVALILYRYAHGGSDPKNSVNAGFSDVPSGQYYTGAVKWCAENKIITGYGPDFTNFGPLDDVTREQLATMLYRYAKEYKKIDVTADSTAFNKMPDASKVSKFAKDGLIWATDKEIITGLNGKIAPGSSAWRAAMAKMITLTARLIG